MVLLVTCTSKVCPPNVAIRGHTFRCFAKVCPLGLAGDEKYAVIHLFRPMGVVMFFGREYELRRLKELLDRPTASLVTCRGRRRIGKSTLFEHFAALNGCRFIKLERLAPRLGTIIGQKAIDEMSAQVAALPRKRSVSVRTALVYDGELEASIKAQRACDFLIPSSDSGRDSRSPRERKKNTTFPAQRRFQRFRLLGGGDAPQLFAEFREICRTLHRILGQHSGQHDGPSVLE